MKPRLLPLLLTGTLLLAGSLSGCAAFSQDSASPSRDGKVRVVASFYPLQYLAQRVAGSRADVVNLTKPGGEPHDLEIPPKETAQIVDADLVLYESGFQPAVDDAIGQNSSGTTLDASDVVDLVAPDHDGRDHGSADHGSAESTDHADLDPHFWQDPDRMATLGQAVAKKLAGIDPSHAAEYAANARDLSSDLTTLGAAYERGLARCQRDTVVVSHDAFGYLSKYGLVMEPIAGLSPGAEPTPADLARLEDLIRSDGITTVFSERLVSPRLSASLAHDVGVRTAVLDPIEGLSDQTADDDYLSLMRQNLSMLRKADGCS